jgi:hypothetical protein
MAQRVILPKSLTIRVGSFSRTELRFAVARATGGRSMGELVAFRQSAAPKQRLPKKTETAEILFFTGVRYVPQREQEKLLKRIRGQVRRAAQPNASRRISGSSEIPK